MILHICKKICKKTLHKVGTVLPTNCCKSVLITVSCIDS